MACGLPGVQIGIEQRQFAVDRGGVAAELRGAGNFEGHAGGGDDVVDALLEPGLAQEVGEGAGDLAVEFTARDFFAGKGLEVADILGRNVAAAGVVLGNGARQGRIVIDH